MTTSHDTCQWPTGTASSGPHVCGRKARAEVTDHYWEGYAGIVGAVMPVCGTHANKAKRYGDMKVTEPARGAVNNRKIHPCTIWSPAPGSWIAANRHFWEVPRNLATQVRGEGRTAGEALNNLARRLQETEASVSG